MATITQDTRPYDVVVATNRFLNPTFNGPAFPVNEASMSSVTIVNDGGNSKASGTATATSTAAIRLQPNVDRPVAVAGQHWWLKGKIKNPNASTRQMALNLRFYDTAGATLGSAVAGGTFTHIQTITAGAEMSFATDGVAPAGTASVGVFASRSSGTGAAVSDLLYADDVYLGLEDVAMFAGWTTDTIDFQYDWTGTANESTSTKSARNTNTDPVDPTQILGYNVTRKVRTIAHDIVGRAEVEAVLSPAGLRSGTLEYLFDTAAKAARAENIHAQGVSPITLTGDAVFGTMRYIPQGEIGTHLDLDTGAMYVLTTGFQEIL